MQFAPFQYALSTKAGLEALAREFNLAAELGSCTAAAVARCSACFPPAAGSGASHRLALAPDQLVGTPTSTPTSSHPQLR